MCVGIKKKIKKKIYLYKITLKITKKKEHIFIKTYLLSEYYTTQIWTLDGEECLPKYFKYQVKDTLEKHTLSCIFEFHWKNTTLKKNFSIKFTYYIISTVIKSIRKSEKVGSM